MPLLIENKKKRELGQILDHPRFLGDLRNVFDFAGTYTQTYIKIHTTYAFAHTQKKKSEYPSHSSSLPPSSLPPSLPSSLPFLPPSLPHRWKRTLPPPSLLGSCSQGNFYSFILDSKHIDIIY